LNYFKKQTTMNATNKPPPPPVRNYFRMIALPPPR
jgi:hypothetical protein